MHHELLAAVIDRLGILIALTSELPAAVKVRGPMPSTFPRPVTELDKARKALKVDADQRYDDDLLGDIERAQQRWRDLPDEERERISGGGARGGARAVEP